MHSPLLKAERPTVAIETHGCKLNQADSSALAWEFARAGFRLVAPEEPADVYVLNTCTVTHIADRKARHALRAARRRSPGATIVATGCYAQRAPQDLKAMEEVDLVIGNRDKATLVRQVAEWRGEVPVPCATGAEPEAFSPRIARTRAMVKIQEGCDQVCAYCIVPRVRGRERSIPPEDILAQIGRHVAQGYREVVLTGTQLGSYGFDIPGMDITRLVARILEGTDVARLRISSLQPQDITQGLLRLWADPRLCPHLHIPLQSGSDAVLRRMRRRYTARLYRETLDLVRQMVPDVAITTDVIVGFPGETEEEFEETLALCQQAAFAAMHVFPYSARPGTSAAHFGGQVPAEVKDRRVQRLLHLADAQAAGFRMALLGQVRPVLWEEARETDGLWTGLTDNYVRVAARSQRPLANEVTPARLVRVVGETVYAEVQG